ncbi:hypothetical protein HBO12_10620 [Pseudomonas sp. WS 5059]|jgi:hypothetical protein|uniref:hypothetical protein n=1 Tax=unclassified Pseudomonas TaxID=196821 RepID=UPI001473E578|nr:MULTISPECIES: hypothetical protein [unclassified Pseudomonas]NMX63742.1 hypothetical protein [Pseudomonas sp. WS 5079]NMX69179.1 hypothetical protein [Pseudomonas sp. WS 5111]NMX86834.1 hypothetical protein [Pseudomonas sp. WS 5010]NMY03404.1 hypothetical protein [Pseudomonas sp. WS 5059]NMY26676.1 hypothetical protein [Pseudomonas sp. WS 5021]
MVNKSDSDNSGSSDAATPEVIEIKIDSNNPNGKTTVTGEYSLHGYKGAIEVEYTWRSNVYTITALRYLFERTAVTGKNPRFEITRDTDGPSGPTLSVNPPQDGQWHSWGSSMSYQTANTALFFTFYFIFDAPPEGVWRTDRKILKLTVY